MPGGCTVLVSSPAGWLPPATAAALFHLLLQAAAQGDRELAASLATAVTVDTLLHSRVSEGGGGTRGQQAALGRLLAAGCVPAAHLLPP